MKVIPFEEKYRQDFINFNTDWIVSNFGILEEHDKETFENIDEELKAGAMIFLLLKIMWHWQLVWQCQWRARHGKSVSWVPIKMFPIKEQGAQCLKHQCNGL